MYLPDPGGGPRGPTCYRFSVLPFVFLMVLAPGVFQEPPSPRVLHEAVSVERVMVDARVLHRGQAVRGLGLESFRVRIDGDPANLKLWRDFTADKDSLDRALARKTYFN